MNCMYISYLSSRMLNAKNWYALFKIHNRLLLVAATHKIKKSVISASAARAKGKINDSFQSGTTQCSLRLP